MNTPAIRRTLFIFGFAAMAMIVINLLTDRHSFWAIWPVWAFSMPAAAAIGALRLRRHRLLGIWLGGGFMLIVGLAGIDITNGGNWWAFWPAGAWLALSALFTALSVDLLATIPTHPPRPSDDISPS